MYVKLYNSENEISLEYLSEKSFNHDNQYLTSFDIIYSLIISNID